VDLEIRRASSEDASEISRLTAALGYPTTEAGVRARLGRFANDDHRVLVAIVEGRLAGWIHIALRASVESETWSEILGFIVDEGARSRGIGGGLLQAAREWSTSRGVDRMRVRSKDSRKGAHGFYEAWGFRFVKTQRVMDWDLRSGS
jgi:GNAT superfamily N-acetyltransferase